MTGLFLLAPHLTEQNAQALLAEVRGKSRKAIEQILARWFPRPDVEPRMDPIACQGALPELGLDGHERSGPIPAPTCPGQVTHRPEAKVEPLSASSYRVEFTASPELVAKIEQAQELLSHTLPGGELPALFERALDALIERELGQRRGTEKGRQRQRRPLKPGSRHVPVDVARQVWERDGGQCTFVDASGRRCSERRFLTLEHKHPHALGGAPTVENLCLFCSSHNAHTARQVFGAAHIDKKRAEREQTETKVSSALCNLGFGKRQVRQVMAELRLQEITPEPEPLLRAGLALLVPPLS
jgi:5-methylcytosine-specific restriction endonuclease McrA